MTNGAWRTVMRVALAGALCAGSAFAGAQPVYRCGNEYTRVPCSDGSAVDTGNNASTARQSAEARRVAEREKRLGDDMARDRRLREAQQRPAMATSLGPAKPRAEADAAASASLKPKKKAKGKIRVVGEDDFIATVPKAKKEAVKERAR